MLYKLKLYCKYWFHTFLQFGLVFFFAWFNDSFLEMIIITICFFLFKSRFEKQFHAKTTWLCTGYTIVVCYIVSLISPNITTSILLIIIFTYLINDISYYLRDYLDILNTINNKVHKEVKIEKGIDKSILEQYCEMADLSSLDKKILIDFYCNRHTILKIAYATNFSYDNVYIRKKKALKKIRECFK